MTLRLIPHEPSGRHLHVGGRIRPAEDAHKGVPLRLHLRAARLADVGIPPQTLSYAQLAAVVLALMYLNDSLGDCVIAWGYHLVGIATGNANAGQAFEASSAQILADYGAIGGYVPGNPATDGGCDEITAFQYWMKNGFADGTKLAGYAAVDATNPSEIMDAIDLFENVTFGVELPDAWVAGMGTLRPGFVWDVVGPPNQNNGHCFGAMGYGAPGVQVVGYTASGLLVVTWGMLGIVTWAAVAAYAVESAGGALYTLITPDMIARGQQNAPNGVNWTGLLADLAQIPGAVESVPPSAAPSAPPAPPSTPPSPPVIPPQTSTKDDAATLDLAATLAAIDEETSACIASVLEQASRARTEALSAWTTSETTPAPPPETPAPAPTPSPTPSPAARLAEGPPQAAKAPVFDPTRPTFPSPLPSGPSKPPPPTIPHPKRPAR